MGEVTVPSLRVTALAVPSQAAAPESREGTRLEQAAAP